MNEKQEIAIHLKGINKTFTIHEHKWTTLKERLLNLHKFNSSRKICALKDISLDVKKGEFFGIIGRNGSGKSTLLKIMAGVYLPDRGGKVTVKGRFMRLSLGLGFSKELSARQNIYTNASLLGLTFRQTRQRLQEIIRFAELEDFLDTQIKYFSSGMSARLKFAVALHADADIFLMDEFWGGVGDQKFQEKCMRVFDSTFVDGRTVVAATHSMKLVQERCDRALLLHEGEMICLDKPDIVVERYQQLLNESS